MRVSIRGKVWGKVSIILGLVWGVGIRGKVWGKVSIILGFRT